jgi:hypothetical protein
MMNPTTVFARMIPILLLLQPFATTARAVDPPVVLVLLDEDSIDNGQVPLFLTPEDVNDHIAAAGVRDPLPYFSANIGRRVTLPVGGGQDPGWFGLDAAPAGWTSSDSSGLENYVLAGPGLGSPDEDGDRESLLGAVAGVSALGATDLTSLVGRDVCAVVYDGDLAPAIGETSLAGATLGLVAFQVHAVLSSDPASPRVEVDVRDPATICAAQIVSVMGI